MICLFGSFFIRLFGPGLGMEMKNGQRAALAFPPGVECFSAAPALRSAAGVFAQGREKSKTAAGDPRRRPRARAGSQRRRALTGHAGHPSRSAEVLGALLRSARSLSVEEPGKNFRKNFY